MTRLSTVLVVALLLCSCSYFLPRRATRGPVMDDGLVVFRYYAPSARRVQVAGDWPGNNWGRGDGVVGEANVGLMEDDDGDGVWEIAIELPAGRHHYLFWVDENTWHTDPGNPDEVTGGPAGVCSLLLIDREKGQLTIR